MSSWPRVNITQKIQQALLLGISLLGILSAQANHPTLPELKAAYTLNFARFTDWPAPEQTTAPLQFCVVGNNETTTALMELKGTIYGRPVMARSLRLPGNIEGCALLYLTDIPQYRLSRILTALKGKTLLTISDIPGFASKGGMIELLIKNQRLRFKINRKAVHQSGLKLDIKLLKLAIHVYPKDLEQTAP